MTIGSNIALGPGQGGSVVLSAQAILSGLQPHDWWDFTDETSLSKTGSDIDSIANKGISNDALARTADGSITHDGSKGVCSGSQNSYYAGTAGDRNFLHDGSGMEIYFVLDQFAASNEQILIASHDLTLSSFNEGIRLSAYQNLSTPVYGYRVGYGSNQFSALTPNNSLTIGSVMVTSMRIYSDASSTNDITVHENGSQLSTQSDAGLLSSSNHNAAVRLLTSFSGNIYGILFFDRPLNTTERGKLMETLGVYYPVA